MDEQMIMVENNVCQVSNLQWPMYRTLCTIHQQNQLTKQVVSPLVNEMNSVDGHGMQMLEHNIILQPEFIRIKMVLFC